MKQSNAASVLLLLILAVSVFAQSYTWKNVNLQGMGYVDGIAVHPTSKDIYIRMDVGGAMRWDGVNSSWIPITDGMITDYSVEGLALNPSNANEVFVVCGNQSAGKLYQSSDKGATWQQLSNFSVYVAGNDAWRDNDPRLSVDPNNGGKVMFFASRQNGLWKSTNSGVNWTQVTAGVLPLGTAANGGQAFVVFDPATGNASTNSTTLYVGVSGSGIYKSSNGGTSFSLLSGGPAAATYNPVHASVASNGNVFVTYCQGWNDGLAGKIYKYAATTGTATDITPASNNGKSFGPIDVCASDPNKLITFQWRMGITNGIHYSTNGGTSWSSKTCSFANFNAPAWWNKDGAINWDYCGGIAFDPNDPQKIWFTFGHGVFTTNDITVANPVYNTQMKGLEELVVIQVCAPPSPNPNHVLSAVADQQGFTSTNRDLVPTASWGGTQFGMASSIDYCVANPNFVIRVSDNEQWTAPAGYCKYSTNGGTTWLDVPAKPAGAASGNIAVSATSASKMVWAPINSNGNGLIVRPYYTTNQGTSWTMSTGIPVGDNFCSQQWSQSKFLVSDRVNGNKFYYYSWNNTTQEFYRSTDGGVSFTKVSTNSLPGNWQMKMDAFPGIEGKLLCCTKSGSSLYLSTNSGDTWTTMPNITGCQSFGFGKAISPSVNPTIFIKATVNGVDGIHYSKDNGTTWTNIYGVNIPGGLADITGSPNEEYTMYLGTSGRGVLYGTASAPAGVRPSRAVNSSKDKIIIHNPSRGSISIDATSFKNTVVSNLSIVDLAGKTIYHSKGFNGSKKMVFDLSSISIGTYIVRFESSEYTLIKRLMIIE